MNEHDGIWKPHVTVAAVIERDGKYLMVEEETDSGHAINQPAGHLEDGEDLISAMVRETLEETAWTVEPISFIGTYQWSHPKKDITYLRFAFSAQAIKHHPDSPLDQGIIAAKWLDMDNILATRSRHRGPQVLQCIEDYKRNEALPLSTIKSLSGL